MEAGAEERQRLDICGWAGGRVSVCACASAGLRGRGRLRQEPSVTYFPRTGSRQIMAPRGLTQGSKLSCLSLVPRPWNVLSAAGPKGPRIRGGNERGPR